MPSFEEQLSALPPAKLEELAATWSADLREKERLLEVAKASGASAQVFNAQNNRDQVRVVLEAIQRVVARKKPTPQEMSDRALKLTQLLAEQEKQVRALHAEWVEVVKVYGETTEAAQGASQAYWKAADAYRQTREEYERAAAPVVRTTAADTATAAWGISIVLMVGITAVAIAKKRAR